MIYDVSLAIAPAMAVWPGDPAVERTDMQFGDWRVSRWTLGSHTGTHVDAPIHAGAGPGTADDLDPAVLIGPCRVLDLGDAPLVTADLLRAHDLAGVTRLLLRTRNSRCWAEDPTRFREDYTAIAPDAARYLVDRGLRLLGVDWLSVEPFGGDGTVHATLLAAGIVVVEGLNLSAVPAGDYRLLCAPLKLAGADGAPARVFLEG
jgi:arylformamidase